MVHTYQQALEASLERGGDRRDVLHAQGPRRPREREARRITESRLMEEEARHRHEEHDRRRREQQKKPLTEKVKEVVGVR
jgi:hypothetical protein